MDTKSKSSKKFSFLAAGIAVMLATALFMACYPVFEKQAASHYTDPLRSGEMLQYFYKSNLVFYKNMLDKVQGGENSYADLYLLTEEKGLSEGEKFSEDDMDRNYGELLEERSLTEYKDSLERAVSFIVEGWENDILDIIFKNMDYCAVDHKTGEILKNTGRKIEALYEDKSRMDEDVPYVYYVRMDYDEKGNLANVAVRDDKPDELLKNVQSIMAGKWLENDLVEHSYRYNLSNSNTVYFDSGREKLTYRIQDKPKDVTFIYACTEQQKKDMISVWKNSSFSYHNEIRWAYYQAGTSAVYWAILGALAIAALALTGIKRYCLHQMAGVQIHLEISLTAIVCMIGGVESLITELVYFTNNGFSTGIFAQYQDFLTEESFPMAAGCVSAAALILIFGAWFYLITSLGEVFELGLKEFVKERSLLIGLTLWLIGKIRKKTNQLKEEVLHVDLGKGAEGTVRKLVLVNFLILAAICFLWMFGWAALVIYTAVLYIGLKKYVRKIQEQYRKLLAATRSIANGNLQTKFEDDWGVFESYKEELSKIQNGFKAAVDEEVKSQKMKTDLITNVSHDLKTPLTAITTYIELLGEENITPEQRKEYLQVLSRKSERLKFLIEDLFEVSRASSGNVTLNPVDVDICHLMRQVYLEYEDKVEDADLFFRFRMPEEKVILQLDSQKTYRIFENLYVNIIKYAMPHTRVYVNAEKTGSGIHIELKNMSAAELNIPAQDLTERFVRGDSSRNTEGSGLGLAIARCFVELQGGVMKVEIDGDLFKVVIEWQANPYKTLETGLPA